MNGDRKIGLMPKPIGNRHRSSASFRLTTLRKVSSILDCQPSPVALKWSITSGLRRSDTSFFVGALLGPRPLSRVKETLSR
jgi:hypothetical protein